MNNEEFVAFTKALSEYPTQDNEGYVPDRVGFKAGWFAALNWVKQNPAKKETAPTTYKQVSTRLENIAVIAMQGLLANSIEGSHYTPNNIAKEAVEYSLALMKELEKHGT